MSCLRFVRFESSTNVQLAALCVRRIPTRSIHADESFRTSTPKKTTRFSDLDSNFKMPRPLISEIERHDVGIPLSNIKQAVWINDIASLNAKTNFIPFSQMLDERRDEAQRSLLVQVKRPQDAEQLFDYCTRHYGPIRKMFLHEIETAGKTSVCSYYYLIEFKTVGAINKALCGPQTAHHNPTGNLVHCKSGFLPIPVRSQLMWFRHASQGQKSEVAPYLPIQYDFAHVRDNELDEYIARFKDVSQQMLAMYTATHMTELSIRLRFLACAQIERAVSGLFPMARVLPFGSTVSSLGSSSSDMDMVIWFDPNNDLQDCESEMVNSGECDQSDSILTFHAKGALWSMTSSDAGPEQAVSRAKRVMSQRVCDQLSSMIQAFLPGCQSVMNILAARVPIIRFEHTFLGLQCDLSTSSRVAVYTSELFYVFSHIDWRLRPLLFFIKHWAKSVGLVTSKRPTPLFTNFQLSLLVIYYMQQLQLLPSLDRLRQLARDDRDTDVIDDNITVTFLRDISNLQSHINSQYLDYETGISSHQASTLADLALGFFTFYESFDFKTKSVSIVTGDTSEANRSLQKSETRPVYGKFNSIDVDVEKGSRRYRRPAAVDIVNPIEMDLNVADNVQAFAVVSLRRECSTALNILLEARQPGAMPFHIGQMNFVGAKNKNKKIKKVVADKHQQVDNSTSPTIATEYEDKDALHDTDQPLKLDDIFRFDSQPELVDSQTLSVEESKNVNEHNEQHVSEVHMKDEPRGVNSNPVGKRWLTKIKSMQHVPSE